MNITNSTEMIVKFNAAMTEIFGAEASTNLMTIPSSDIKDISRELQQKKAAYIAFLDTNHAVTTSLQLINYTTKRKILGNIDQFIESMKVKSNSTKTTFDVTLHDRIGRGTTVDKDEGNHSPDGGIFTSRSYHCESLTLFMAILTAGLYLNSLIFKNKNITLTFKFSKGLFGSGSGLLKSVKKCSGKVISADKDPVKENIYNFNIDDLMRYSRPSDEAAKAFAQMHADQNSKDPNIVLARTAAAAAPNDHYKPQQRIYDKKLRIEKCSTKPGYLGSCTGKNEGVLKVDFDSDTTVGNLKSVILDKLKIPFDNQYLLFNANETSVELTDNNRTLQSYGIINNDSRIEFYVLTADEAKDAPPEDNANAAVAAVANAAPPAAPYDSDNPSTDPLSYTESDILTDEEYQKLKGTRDEEQKKMTNLITEKTDLTNALLLIPKFTVNRTKEEEEEKEKITTRIDKINTEVEKLSRELTAATFAYMRTPNYKTDSDYTKYNIPGPKKSGGSKSRRKHRRHNKHPRKTRHKRGGRRTRSYKKHTRKSKSHKRMR